MAQKIKSFEGSLRDIGELICIRNKVIESSKLLESVRGGHIFGVLNLPKISQDSQNLFLWSPT